MLLFMVYKSENSFIVTVRFVDMISSKELGKIFIDWEME